MGVQSGGAGHNNPEVNPTVESDITTGGLTSADIDLGDATGSVIAWEKNFNVTPTSSNSNIHTAGSFDARKLGSHNITGDLLGLKGQVSLDSTATGTVSMMTGVQANPHIAGNATATEVSAFQIMTEVTHVSGVITDLYGFDFANHDNSGTITNTYAYSFENSSDWLTTDNEWTAVNIDSGDPFWIPMSVTSEQIAYTRTLDGPNEHVLKAGLTMGADIDGTTAFLGQVTGFSSGAGGGNAVSTFKALMAGDDNDSSIEYYAFDAGDFTSNGGSNDGVGLNIGTGFTDILIATSGDIEFEDYAVTIVGVQSEETDQDGFDLTIQAMDGYDSGATARAGGDLVLKRGSAVNAGTEGSVIIDADNATAGTGKMVNGQLYFWLDEGGNNLKVEVKYSEGTTKTATIAFD